MFDYISIIIAVLAIIIAMISWRKSRSIYDIEKFKFPKKVGDSKTQTDRDHENALKKKLKSGEWQILHIYDYNSEELMIVIGKIKEKIF